jgi:hypothetical protein
MRSAEEPFASYRTQVTIPFSAARLGIAQV